MRTIAIILCDNDFGNTFRNLLETIYNLLIYLDGSDKLTTKHIEKSIREGIRFHYLAFQHIEPWGTDEDREGTIKYLNDRIKVLFDNEAEEFMKDKDHDGGSWYLEVRTGRVYSF